jgi:hypothetical protein
MRIAFDISLDPREVNDIRERQRQPIDLCPSDHGQLGGATRPLHSLFDRRDGQNAIRLPSPIASQNEIGAARKRLADRLEGLATHQDGLAHRGRFETLEVLGQSPGQRVVAADDPIARHRDDERDDGGLRGHGRHYRRAPASS